MIRRDVLKYGVAIAAIAFAGPNLVAPAFADAMADAQAIVAKYASKVDTWDGPTSGPKGAEGKTIVILGADMKNGGILGVSKGVEEAAAALGWTVKTLDGAGSVGGRTAAFGQALALKPDGIIINGFDAVEQKPAMEEAKAAGIPMVSWHAGPGVGPIDEVGVLANVGTDAMEVSKAAANWAYRRCQGQAGRHHLHRLHLRHRNRQGRQDEGRDRGAGRHGA